MKRYIALLLTVVAFLAASAAEKRTVAGRVLDATTLKPIAGVVVRAAEVNGFSTLTADDGSYELTCPAYVSQLSATSPDYNVAKIGLAKESRQRDILLYPSTFSADYTAKTNVLGTQTASDFRFTNGVTIEEEIQKRLGAQVRTITRNGTPGVGGVMFVQGLNSLYANAQPLVVIDGVIFDQQYDREVLHQGFHNDILSNINPADIESVEVLRAGTSMYGAKGANGVLLINTRRNHSMATRITASASAGVAFEPKHFDVMNASQYRSYASDLLATTGTTARDFKFLNDDPAYYYFPQYHNNTDWKKDIYRSAFTQNYSINVEGGDNVADYNLSLGYTNHQSTLEENSMNRLNIRFNSDIHLTKNFDIRFDASFTNQTRNLRNDGAPANYTDGTPTSPAFLAYAKSPMLSPYTFASGVITPGRIDVNDESYLDEVFANNGRYNYRLANPLAILDFGSAENKNHFENSLVNLSVSPSYRFGKYITASEHFSYTVVNTNQKYYIPLNGVPAYYVASVDSVCENEVRASAGKQNSVMSDTRIDFARRYGAHNIHAFGGARVNWESYTVTNELGYNTGSDKMPIISSALAHAKVGGTSEDWKSIAWYLHAAYDYKQRYYIQAGLVAETSSRFGREAGDVKAFSVPWGLFPGVQATWVMTAEPWLANIKGIDYLAVKAAFDVSGNDDIAHNASRTYFAAPAFLEDLSGLAIANIGNTQLKWETTKRWQLGLEASLLDNRLGLAFNYYRSTTDDLLTYKKLHYTTGLAYNWDNGGSLSGEGFDLTVNAKPLALKDFQWEIGASLGHYKNKIKKLSDGLDHIDNTVYGATVRTAVGSPANLFYGYRTDGVFATSEDAAAAGLTDANGKAFRGGDMRFVDSNNDNIIDEKDMAFIGDPNPDIYGNIFTSLNYKRFRLDVNFNYSLGGDVFNYMRQQMESGSRFMNQTTALTSRWQTEGQATNVPRATFDDPMGNARFSDRWIEDGSYLRLKTVTLSYTLPMNTAFLQGFQFWIQANNLFTISKYLGSDPEFAATGSVIGQGIDTGCLPQSRSIVAGVKINL